LDMAGLDEWLNRELTAKLLALAVAVTLWVVVVFDEQGLPKSPPPVTLVERTYSVSLAVREVGTGLIVTHAPESVELRVRGSLESLRVSAGKVQAELNLVGQQEGQIFAKVQLRVPAGLEVLSVEPPKAPVTLERIVTRVFPVRVGLIGSPDIGHSMGVVTMQPTTAEVEGPTGSVSRIKFVMAFVEVTGAAEDKAQTVSLCAMDDASRTVDGVTIGPDKVRAVVPIYKLPAPAQVGPRADSAVVPAPASRSDAPPLVAAQADSPAPAVQPTELPLAADPASTAPGEPAQ